MLYLYRNWYLYFTVLLVALYVYVAFKFSETDIEFLAISAAFLIFYLYTLTWYQKWNDKIMIEYYAGFKLCIVEGHRSPYDTNVWIRVEEHKNFIVLSGNEVVTERDIHAVYFRDKDHFHETWEEYQTRFDEEKKRLESVFVRRIGSRDEKWTKEYFYNQKQPLKS